MIRKSVQAMDGYTPGEQPDGAGIIKLNTNENPYPPSPAVRRALTELNLDHLRRYPDPVSDLLRAHIAAMHGVAVSQVFAGNGSDEVLALCTRAFVENQGAIGYFDPSYSLYPVLADIRDVAHRPIELGPEFAWTVPDGYTASLFFMTNPNAPTSLFYPREVVHPFCADFPGVVVLDEAYVDFADTHCMDFAIEFDNVLVARTLSKSYSLAGLRVGYLVGSAALIEALYKIKDSYNLNAISQHLALAALADPDHMRRNVARIVATRQRLSDALSGLGFTVYPSQTNFVWARPAAIDAAELFRKLKHENIYIRYFPGPRTGAYVRITVGTDPEIDRLLEAVREIVA